MTSNKTNLPFKVRSPIMVEVRDWDKLVVDTYKRPYIFQQQDNCKERGIYHLTVPSSAYDYENDTIPEEVNGREMGVSFSAWLERNPNQPIPDNNYLDLWWERNFYPTVEMIANDLHSRVILPAGEYVINIDW